MSKFMCVAVALALLHFPSPVGAEDNDLYSWPDIVKYLSDNKIQYLDAKGIALLTEPGGSASFLLSLYENGEGDKYVSSGELAQIINTFKLPTPPKFTEFDSPSLDLTHGSNFRWDEAVEYLRSIGVTVIENKAAGTARAIFGEQEVVFNFESPPEGGPKLISVNNFNEGIIGLDVLPKIPPRPGQGGQGEGNLPGQGEPGEGNLPGQGGQGEGNLPGQGEPGEGNLPGQGGQGEGNLPGQGGQGEGNLPGQGGQGEGNLPGQGGQGEGNLPGQGGQGEGNLPGQGGQGEGNLPGQGGGGFLPGEGGELPPGE